MASLSLLKSGVPKYPLTLDVGSTSNLDTRRDIIIIDPALDARIDDLRVLDRKDLLVCPECRKNVRVRAGEVNRWHFAHKVLEDCSFGQESADLLHARAVLYRWLLKKFGSGVQIEKRIEHAGLPRPIDCWYEEDNHKIAYWIVDTQLKPDIRNSLKDVFRTQAIWGNWVFCKEVLKGYDGRGDALLLSKTEREFMAHTEYDELMEINRHRTAGGTLHYLDAEAQTLITYRGLHLEHEPQLFAGIRKESPLTEIQIKQIGGEF